MKVLNHEKELNGKEIHFYMKPDSTGDINIFISDERGVSATLAMYISRDGTLRRCTGLDNTLLQLGFCLEDMQFDDEGRIVVSQ